ncbi:hypothetical protein HNV12_01855 [Methanococcoides sp. SA1]|nr:hypothetical protein [Methanococcoides sp. SA1]
MKYLAMVAMAPSMSCVSLKSSRKNLNSVMLDVPFISGTDPAGCLPYSMKGVCEYYGIPSSLDSINDGLGRKFGEASYFTTGAVFLSGLGLNVDFYCNSTSVDSENVYDSSAKFVPLNELSSNGVDLFRENLSLEYIVSSLERGNPSLVFVDGNVLKGEPKKGIYLGHFVTVVGADDENVYLNDHMKTFGNSKVEKSVFEASRFGVPESTAIMFDN